ncbi:MAG TPA: carboxypeptidase-like regulatory domain-containing protein [Candidatus Acidoferrales bacterium]|nr:carboxypeptidase-like regulatory domain-containing protein [Candidatus Acidoferrales bacterium]
MKKSLLAIALVALALSCDLSAGQQPPEPGHGTVSGLIRDVNGGLVTDAEIDLNAPGRTHRGRTNSRGAYSIELSPGVYSMEIKHYGFCGLRRGEFILKPRAIVYFETELRVCPSDSVNSKFFYDDLAVVPDGSLRPLILYGEKAPDGSAWRYTGPVLDAIGTYPVVFTYNLLTISADSLLYDSTSQHVVARGRVTFQDGKTVSRGSNFEITLSGLYPVGKLADKTAAP